MEDTDFNEEYTGPNCSNDSSLTTHQRTILLWTLGGTAMVSVSMCLIALSVVVCLKSYRFFSYRLAAYQVLSSLVFNITQILALSLLGDDDSLYYEIACRADAFLLQYTVWVKLLFTLCLSFHFFCLTVFLKSFENWESIYILVSILFPFLPACIPFIHYNYGLVGAWCWIKEWKHDCATNHYLEGTIEQSVLWYGPLFVSLILVVISFMIIPVVIACRACRKRQDDEAALLGSEEKQVKAIKRLLPLLAYPLMFLLLAIFPLVNRIFSPTSQYASYRLALAHAITEPSWGIFTSIAILMHIGLEQRMIKRRRHNKNRSANTRYADSVVFTAVSTTHYAPHADDSISGFDIYDDDSDEIDISDK